VLIDLVADLQLVPCAVHGFPGAVGLLLQVRQQQLLPALPRRRGGRRPDVHVRQFGHVRAEGRGDVRDFDEAVQEVHRLQQLDLRTRVPLYNMLPRCRPVTRSLYMFRLQDMHICHCSLGAIPTCVCC